MHDWENTGLIANTVHYDSCNTICPDRTSFTYHIHILDRSSTGHNSCFYTFLDFIIMTSVHVVSRYTPEECLSKVGNGDNPESTATGEEQIILDESSERNDAYDDFNHPRRRRALILQEFYRRNKIDGARIAFEAPARTARSNDQIPLGLYRKVHSKGLIEFLTTAWDGWKLLGQKGRDPSCIPFSSLVLEDPDDEAHPNRIPPLIPSNFAFPRDNNRFPPHHPQRSSKNVMGQIGYYCTDTCTPIVAELLEELVNDEEIVRRAVDVAIDSTTESVVYALCTHPGHHASHDSFGGYCYVNNAALTARLLQEKLASAMEEKTPKVAILDVDYHCGNGTASIFYNDPTVLVVSIHCHPDFEYPFHSGFGDEIGGPNAEGCTLHVPLLPGAQWESEYRTALQTAGTAIANFGPDAVVTSLGLDTHAEDPCATRRAGFLLGSNATDYDCMGRVIGDVIARCSNSKRILPTIVLQEGGYKLDAVPTAAADVVLGIAATVVRDTKST